MKSLLPPKSGSSIPARSPNQVERTFAVQAKLSANQPGDAYEQEADAMADQVMRKCDHCEKEEETIQRKEALPGMAGEESALSGNVSVGLHGSGAPLDRSTRNFMEQRFGHNFGAVRIHNDPIAQHSAAGINALAYTSRNHIAFAAGEYEPQSESGRKLIAHELTHVLQQRSGGHAGGLVQRQERNFSGGEVTRIPPERYVDNFKESYYDIDYRSEHGGLSKWIKLTYGDGVVLEINIDDIAGKSMSEQAVAESKGNGHVVSGRAFPADLNSSTTPRLWAAKQQVLLAMDDYNTLFILGSFSAIWLIIVSAGIPPIGVTASATRSPLAGGRVPAVRNIPLARAATGAADEAAAGESSAATASAADNATAGAARPQPLKGGGGGNQRASSQAGARNAAPAEPPLTAQQEKMVKDLLDEHPGLTRKVAADSVKGAQKVGGAGVKGADVTLLNGQGREVSVHTGALRSLGSHLQEEARQAGTNEIYLQISNSSITREIFLKELPALRSGYPELNNIFVKIFGPDGATWWNGLFRGPT